MRASNRTPGNFRARHILVIDIGGAHVKFRVDARGPVRKFVSGPQMSPASMMRQLLELTGNLSFDALSIGYPGLVFRGRIAAERLKSLPQDVQLGDNRNAFIGGLRLWRRGDGRLRLPGERAAVGR